MGKYPKNIRLMTGLAIIFWTIFTFARHLHFQTQAWDMGIFDQLFWNTVHGSFMKGTLEELPGHFGIHFSPTLLMLVPIYAILPSPYTLLFLQTAALMAGAFPLFEIARRKLPDPFPAIIVASYLLSPSLHWITIYDFHEIAFFIPLFIFAWNFAESENIPLAALFFGLAAGTKEDAILAVLFAGLAISAINRKNNIRLRNFGALIAAASLIYFLIVIKIFMPYFGGGLLRIDRYSHLGNSAGEIIYNALTNPLLFLNTIATAKKISYLFWLLLPAAGVSLLSLPGFLLILPGLAENMLTNFPAQFSGTYQYDAILLPGIFIGSIFGIAFFLKSWPHKKKILKNTLFFAIAAGYLMRSPVNPVFFPFDLFKADERTDAYYALISDIPAGASISANTNLVPHLSGRSAIYVLGSEPRPVDIILADNSDLFAFKNQEDFDSYLASYMNSGLYEFKIAEGRYITIIRKDL